MLKPKPKLLQQKQGFTLVEVLVAVLAAVAFAAVTMQMMVIATIFKARARESAQVTTWIQEQLEDVKYQTTLENLPYKKDDSTTLLVDEAAEKCGKAPTSTESNGYAAALRDKLPALDNTKSVNIESKVFTAINSTDNPRQITGNKFWLMRRSTTDPPYSVLKLSYAVVPDVNGSPVNSSVTIFYYEVIANAALQCP